MTPGGATTERSRLQPVVDDDLCDLPEVVQRYFRSMGVVGHFHVGAISGRFVGEFRLREDRPWLRCHAHQLTAVGPITRTFRMRLRLGHLLPVVSIDAYRRGVGHLSTKAARLTVAKSAGNELDLGELTTWLSDAILYAPSMLLDAGATWRPVGERAFEVTVTDRGLESSATVAIDERGAPEVVVSDDRYADLPGGPVRAPWVITVDGWTTVDGRSVPTTATATWQLPTGPFPYARGGLAPTSVLFSLDSPSPQLGASGRASGLLDAAEGAGRIAVALLSAPFTGGSQATWGATPDEVEAAMPGDDELDDPDSCTTRGVTIDAPPDTVWAWLVQIGHGRGGLYSYDLLEDLIGCGLHSAQVIDPTLQAPEPGTVVALGPKGYPCYRIAAINAPSSLVLRSADPASREVRPDDATASTWQWLLRPIDGGRRTRLVARQRLRYPTGQRPLWSLLAPVAFVMERRMLLGIKERAER